MLVLLQIITGLNTDRKATGIRPQLSLSCVFLSLFFLLQHQAGLNTDRKATGIRPQLSLFCLVLTACAGGPTLAWRTRAPGEPDTGTQGEITLKMI